MAITELEARCIAVTLGALDREAALIVHDGDPLAVRAATKADSAERQLTDYLINAEVWVKDRWAGEAQSLPRDLATLLDHLGVAEHA